MHSYLDRDKIKCLNVEETPNLHDVRNLCLRIERTMLQQKAVVSGAVSDRDKCLKVSNTHLGLLVLIFLYLL